VRILLTCLFLAACTTTTLPHRPVTELTDFGQGRNPGRGQCHEGQIPFFLEMDDNSLMFIECMRTSQP
jgi:hypothetical protein